MFCRKLQVLQNIFSQLYSCRSCALLFVLIRFIFVNNDKKFDSSPFPISFPSTIPSITSFSIQSMRSQCSNQFIFLIFFVSNIFHLSYYLQNFLITYLLNPADFLLHSIPCTHLEEFSFSSSLFPRYHLSVSSNTTFFIRSLFSIPLCSSVHIRDPC